MSGISGCVKNGIEVCPKLVFVGVISYFHSLAFTSVVMHVCICKHSVCVIAANLVSFKITAVKSAVYLEFCLSDKLK